MGCFNSTPADDGADLRPGASNPLVKAPAGYGATGVGAGVDATHEGDGPNPGLATDIATGGASTLRGRVVWVGHSAGPDRRHVGYEMLYRVLSVFVGQGSSLRVGDSRSSDPYARVRYQDKILSTNVLHSTLNPRWSQWLHFVGIEAGGPWGSFLLHVLDNDVVGEDDSLGGVLVDVHDEDRRLAPRGRWLPLENTSSGQVFVITMANKFGLLVLMLRQVTISAELLSGIKELSVSIRHMSRAVQFDKSSVTSKSTAEWNVTYSFWTSVGKDAPCVLEVTAHPEDAAKPPFVIASCQFLPREFVNTKGQEASFPLHRGSAGSFGAAVAQYDVAVGQVSLQLHVEGGGFGGMASELHSGSLACAVHHAASALAAVREPPPPGAKASSNLFYPTWTPSEGVGEGKREEVSDHRQRLYTLVEELQACDDCGAKEPKPSWVVTDARRHWAVFVCNRCAGVHRGVGADLLTIQSALYDVDFWTAPNVQAVMDGHAEARVRGYRTPCCAPNADRTVRDPKIRQKYGFPKSTPETVKSTMRQLAHSHMVKVTVVRCDNLVNKDVMSTSDPYVVVQLGHSFQRTPTISNNLNPIWPDGGHVMNTFAWNGEDALRIHVMDADTLVDDPLGSRSVCLDGIPGSDTVMQELEVPLAGVETGTVTLRVLHFDYAEAGKGFNSAASMLRANAVSY